MTTPPSKLPPPCDFAAVLAAEVDDIQARRRALFPDQVALPGDDAPDPRPFAVAHHARALGLAFSGGGIRSATFNLGVLQGLAEVELLPFIDYLSTVSGGGYIGAWLHGMIRNKYDGDPVLAQGELDPRRVPGEPDRDSISFLRRYSNYLAPQLGLLNPDFWTLVAFWLRNMWLNVLIVVPLLAAVVLAVLLAGLLQQIYGLALGIDLARDQAMMALSIAVTVIAVNLRQIAFAQFPELKPRVRLPDLSGRFLVGGASVCIVFASYIFGAFRFYPDPFISSAILVVLFIALQWVGGFRLCYRTRHNGASGWPYMIGIPVVSAVFTAALLWAVWTLTGTWDDPDSGWLRIAFGPPLILAAWMCGTTLQLILMGSDYPDSVREWLTRLGAVFCIGITAWIGLFVLTVFGPYWLAYITLHQAVAGIALAGGWIANGVGGYLLGKNAKAASGATQKDAGTQTRVLESFAGAVPVVFVAGLLLLISLGTHLLLREMVGSVTPRSNCVTPVTQSIPGWLLWLEPVQREYWCVLYYSNHGLLVAAAALLAGCLLIVTLLPLRININDFSMDHFFKNRLVRCYLGASRGETRRPNRLTGLDPFDDFPLADLLPSNPLLSYRGPYPIVNCALNLNAGSELAKQERSAVSYVFTPRYCGFETPRSQEDMAVTSRIGDLEPAGYRATPGYMEPWGPALGTAMAISGTAANPGFGYHSSAPVAFLATILNMRVGWWLGNPRRDRPSARPAPMNAMISLLSEVFAQSNGRSRYLKVSDGGQFDNLGLYELVRRRCRYIVVSDSEADPELAFEGLGNAIRKCGTDFGVEITLDLESIRPENGGSRSHCVIGTVAYPEPEVGFPADSCGRPDPPASVYAHSTGWLLYLKASLTGDEPADIKQYHNGHQQFPHENAADQTFSESQFESYRKLGLHVVRTTFENVATRPSPLDQRAMLAMFQEICRSWYPTQSLSAEKSAKLAERYAALIRRITADPDLAFLDNQLFSGMPEVAQPEATPRKAVYFCMELIQFMEDAFFELNLKHQRDLQNPAYAGWIDTFSVWANSKAVLDAWRVTGSGSNPTFQAFFESLQT